MRATVLLLAAAAAFGVGACQLAHGARGDAIIDTWPVGEARDCAADAVRCDELIRVGIAGVIARDAVGSAVVKARLHQEGAFVDSEGRMILMKRSGGCCQVLVVELADGTTHAIGVGYPGISTEATALPWEMVNP
ncbi:MAG TPA: hypothetical protein VGC90_10595 [Candidatus Limnocylindrales bacterium]